MTFSRRDFLSTLSRTAPATWLATGGRDELRDIAYELARFGGGPDEIARDERFWVPVQQAFTVDRSIINLNNAGVSPSPRLVQDAMKRYLDYSNEAPVQTMWRVLEPQRETVRAGLARMFGCEAEEIAITRNATEALQILQMGFDLRAGDEVVISTQDYPHMIETWRQRERRDRVVLRTVDLPIPIDDPAEVVRRYESAITPRTKLVHMSHMSFVNGQVLPVRAVVRMARGRGIPVIVDGAHAFAHFPFRHADLECDFYAASLHKWMYAPHGTGMLFVRREKIPEIWPLQASDEAKRADIRKFEDVGTHPAANALAVAEAMAFTHAIGVANKAARLAYLRDRWATALAAHPRVRLHTSLRPGHAYAIALVQVEGIEPGRIYDELWTKHRIITSPTKWAGVEGIRVTPNVYTTLDEIDRFVEAMHGILGGARGRAAGDAG
ncbi:aminotransferase class V-fold PLP-dependent enzyme [Longimicrobium sp.]|uniref:aminotransferase class V-fold PLP-dependent enzyme n=1 Tax=Longimicrobium sp. TaxID=2029185 RepID=UPI002CC5397A|nr:aminotransferase class V-fold PLP-dependent enzyme [Longimicrobium sp.]HSU17455.1 aminotransferase class V-fold PLP-dependent enzyme [Longimicrobium sp.]